MDVVLMGFVWALLLIPGCARGGHYEGRLIMEPAEWHDARIACGNLSHLSSAVSCDLATHRPREDGDFWRSQTLTPGLDYWVGARALDVLLWHASGTALIQAQGCYEAPNSALLVRHNALGPERCLVRCDGHIVAMKASQCFCLTENVLSTFTKRRDEECHIFCDRESERCGGSDGNLVSVYKMPANSVLKKSPNKDLRTTRDWFMYRTHTNHQELLVISNAPERSVPNKAILCVNSSGTYEVVSIRSQCSASSKAPSFDSQDVLQFLRATADLKGVTNTRYQLPLSATRRVQWLDGKEANNDTEGKGDCTSVRYYDGQYTLTNRRCKDRLPIVCSCYTKPETPTSTPNTTTTMTTTTTATTTTNATTTATETTASTVPADTKPETPTSTPNTTTTMTTTTTATTTTNATTTATETTASTTAVVETNSTALPSSTEPASSTTAAATAPANKTAGPVAWTTDQGTFTTEGMTTPKPTVTVRTTTPPSTTVSTGAVSSAEVNSTSSERSSSTEASTTAQIPVTSPSAPVVVVATTPSPTTTTATTTAAAATPSTPDAAAASTTLTMAVKTQTASFASSVTSPTSSSSSTIMAKTTTEALITGSSVIAETTAPSRPTAPSTSKASTTENDKWKVAENSTLLFPFDAMTEEKKVDVPLQSASNPAESQPSNAVKGGAATASFSVELIVGVTVAVVVVAVVIIIVIVVIQRRKNSRGVTTTLLTDKSQAENPTNAKSKQSSSYPI